MNYQGLALAELLDIIVLDDLGNGLGYYLFAGWATLPIYCFTVAIQYQQSGDSGYAIPPSDLFA